MRKICLVIFGLVFFAACDLQPKITSIPDTVGDFISSRYPALLADPKTESDIYNSAARDYGVYASPELYGSVDMGDYVNYAGVDDYSLPGDDTETTVEEVSDDASVDAVEESETTTEETDDTAEEDTSDKDEVEEETDVLDIPEYKTDEISVPARAAAGTVIVHRGDTLYAIAREHNMTLDEIAKENNIAAPYTIRVGQVLKLKSETPVKAELKEPAPKKTVAKEMPKSEPKASAKVEEKKAEPKVAKPEPKPASKPESKPEFKPEPKVQKDIRVPIKEIHVARGDTLYSISRQYSVPVNDLAVMNGLSAPFTLSVGQTLHVPDLPAHKVEPVKVATPSAKAAEKRVETKAAPDKKPATTKTDKKPAQKEQVKKSEPKKQESKKVEPKKTETKKPEQKKQETKQSAKKTAPKTEKPVQKSTPKNEKIAARSSSKFSWPVRGTILSHYGAKTAGLYNDGINISAALNTSVVAAENGVVAYAGNEVRGMGNLIIIQHADGWMTVYAHMNSMSVRRGVRVTVGQKIGAVGKTGKVTTPQLHFEIRKGTKAYNPINYLKK